MKRKTLLLCLFLTVCIGQINVSARSFEMRVAILSTENAVVKVTGKLSEPEKHWSFADSSANALNLAGKISGLQFFDERGTEIVFVRQSAGEFETATAAGSFSYEVKLDFPQPATQAAHISWLTKNQGLLMLNDLLPDFGNQASTGKITFVLPPNWKIATSEDKTGENEFQILNPRSAIFLVGNFSEQTSQFEKTQLNLARVGEWIFNSSETFDLAASILAEHKRVFGSLPFGKIEILLIPLPQKFGGEQWEAETRGSTVILCAAPIAFKSRALSKLHEQLRHELFHLWIPNNLNLTGDYAWFYEGFTLYQALKTGVRLKYIRFEDFLDALGRAYDAARFNSTGKTLSLIEASPLRWSANLSELVYAKGMTAAFICDLAVLQQSGGRQSLDDVFRELSRRSQKPNAAQNANQVVLENLKNMPELRSIVEKYVETPGGINWTADLAAAGLQNISKISLTRLAVNDKLNRRQKKLLVRLGYQAIEN